MPLVHHELCFGCGRTNLFGLLLEAEETAPGVVRGRCFIKQDHQGADRGRAHEGILATALAEAMALACGPAARASSLEVRIERQAPVGEFLEIEAVVEPMHPDDDVMHARAAASEGGDAVASARGSYRTLGA